MKEVEEESDSDSEKPGMDGALDTATIATSDPLLHIM
jgi:hypothetical protein